MATNVPTDPMIDRDVGHSPPQKDLH